MNSFAQQLQQHWSQLTAQVIADSGRTVTPKRETVSFAIAAWSYILFDWKNNNQIDKVSLSELKRLENYDFVKSSYDLGEASGYSSKTLEVLGEFIKAVEQNAQDWRTFPASIYKKTFQFGQVGFSSANMSEFLEILNEKLDLEQQVKVEPGSNVAPSGSFKI